MRSRKLLLTSAASLVAASIALPGTAQADEPIKVVATFSILGDMVNQIGGDKIELVTLVGPDGDAHVYQPTPQAAKAVSEADVLILNGLEFEGWLERLTEAASFDGALVVATKGVDAIAFDEHGEEGHDDHDDHDDHAEDKHSDHDEHDHGDEHAGHDDHEDHKDEHADHDDHGDDHAGHDHGAFDPHAWQSVDNAMIYVDNIAEGLAKSDPENAGAFYTNRAAYVTELEALESEIVEMMGDLPEEKRTVVTSHDAFGYFADHYGLRFEAPQGLSTESEPSAADVAELITQIRDEKISAVFVETITDNRLIEQIANETGAAIGGTLYSDALSDEDGPASTYIDMMRHNATTLSSALGS
ncbi:MAG: metal ABC transporter substrate-binding protein [Pseudomonadota bacterium]